jgi:hypothetical protein
MALQDGEVTQYIFDVQAERSAVASFIKSALGTRRPLVLDVQALGVDDADLLPNEPFPMDITCRMVGGSVISFTEPWNRHQKRDVTMSGLQVELPFLVPVSNSTPEWKRVRELARHNTPGVASRLTLKGDTPDYSRKPQNRLWQGHLSIAHRED